MNRDRATSSAIPAGGPCPPRSPRGAEALGLLLLACALAFNALALAPEVRIGRVPLNDSVFHLAAAERLAQALEQGEALLDPWVAEWALGYPLWRTYQPLPHLLAAIVLRAAEPMAEHAHVFATLQYLLLVLLPVSVYAGARLLALGPTAAGLASLLVLAPSGAGELGRYGLGYQAFTWRGSGLYTQLVALHGLVLTLGLLARTLDSGRRRWLGALALALTSLSHLIFGYVAFVSGALLAAVGPEGQRSRRAVRFAAVALSALVLLAWFLVPLLLSRDEIGHSRWEAPHKWDSFGAPMILGGLASGDLLDAGRAPLLTGLVLVGVLASIVRLRSALPRRLLALAAVWLALFFGRATWGHLLLLLGIPADLHLHRFQAAFELSAVLLGAWGADHVIRTAASRSRPLALALTASLAATLGLLGSDRLAHLREGQRWGEESLAAFEKTRLDLEAALGEVRAILAERPGRASAGRAAGWGRGFKVGSVPFYAFLTREHIDQASFLYHALSTTSDLMVLREEGDLAQATAFGVRAVVAPAERELPSLRRRAVHGPFAVYEASAEGYFGLVDVGGSYTGPSGTAYEPSAAWLRSPLLRHGVVLLLGGDVRPLVGRWQPLPQPDPVSATRCGRVVAESTTGETYRARLALQRPCHAFLKITWHPDLAATVDGAPAPLRRVTPGFGAVPVPTGEHEVVVRYEPGLLKPILLALGVLLFVLGARLVPERLAGVESSWADRLGTAAGRLATPRARASLVLAALCLLALRPLFRGRLIDGHDALAYPPRLVEMSRVLGDGHVPPVWAPDLGAGYGQPLFAFAPPLLYVSAAPLRAAGLGLADSLQLALALLHVAGAVGVYRLGRRGGFSRPTSVAGAAAWLFAPYVALDLFVRAAFAEASAVAVAPLALLGLLRAMDRPSLARIAAGGLAVALVPLAHNAAALLLLPALVLIAAVSAPRAPRPVASLCSAAAALASGLGLSAFFWLPALVEKDFVRTDLLREGFLRWVEHFVAPRQLLWSPWGYGTSVPGSADGMSFAVGPLHLLLAAGGVVLALRSHRARHRAETAAFAVIALGGAWLATAWSAGVWSSAGTLQYLAYPWRALLLPALFLPLLALPSLEGLGPRGRVLAAAALVLANVAHTEPRGYLTFDDEYYTPASIAQKAINTTTREEYTPRWVEIRPRYTSERVVGRDALIEVHEQRLLSARQEFTLRAPRATELEAATSYYPGWTVKVDGSEIEPAPVPVRGTMAFPIEAGEHRVVLELRPTRLRRLSSGLSLGTAALLAVGGAVGRRRAGRRR